MNERNDGMLSLSRRFIRHFRTALYARFWLQDDVAVVNLTNSLILFWFLEFRFSEQFALGSRCPFENLVTNLPVVAQRNSTSWTCLA